MSQPLRILSQLLEAGRPILTADELALLDEPLCGLLLYQRILVPARTATHVVCDACHDDHLEEVERIQSAQGSVTFQIVCQEAGWVEVPAHRLRQWTFDIRRLATLMSEAIDPKCAPEEVVREAAWKIGNIRVGGMLYGIVWLNTSIDDSIIRRFAQKFPPEKTILVSTTDLTDRLPTFAAVVPLCMAFRCIENHFEFQADTIRSWIPAGSTTNSNVFRSNADYWEVSFEGLAIHLKQTVGLSYIARLLREPHRDIPAVTLLAARAGIDPLVTSGSSGELLDDQATAELGHRYRELIEELKEAKEHRDIGRIELLETEMNELANILASATGLWGRSRKKSDIEKVRKSVSMAVSRDIDRIAEVHETLGRHLRCSISSGLIFRYAPEHEINWLL